MLTKTCLSCGYRGGALQGPRRALRCPGCGADLYSRPPRSYAELEGFVPSEDPISPLPDTPVPAVGRGRWSQARSYALRVAVVALIVTPPLVVVGAAGAVAAVWMLRR